MLAARARVVRLWILVAVGIPLAHGSHGPASSLLTAWMTSFRAPVKFLFLSDLSLCLLAGAGAELALRKRGGILWTLPGVAFLVAAGMAAWSPGPGLLARIVPEARDPRAQFVRSTVWPSAFASTGVLCLGAGLALWRGSRMSGAAAVMGVLDLLIVNGSLNAAAGPSFYDLRPEVRSLVALTQGSDQRWFSFGAEGSDVPWSPRVAGLNSDVWLYYIERQSLLPRSNVLDGLDAAFDEDRTGWGPRGSTLSALERRPSAFPAIAERLRRASVRWVLSWKPLPEDLVVIKGEARLPEILDPLRLYELRGALPRSYWSPAGLAPDPRGIVTCERPDPHHIRLRVSAPPGLVVITEGFHRDWQATGPSGAPVPLARVDGRYMGLQSSGGDATYTLSFEPSWRTPSLALFGVGCALAAALGLGRFDGRAAAAAAKAGEREERIIE
jgi:hypothetical protein